MKLIPRRNDGNERQDGIVPMHDAIDRFFDDSFMNPFGLLTRDPFLTPFVPVRKAMAMPSMDITESENEFTLVAETPGFSPDNLDIEVNNNTLVLRGHKEEKKDEKEKTWHLHERSEARWERRFSLPSNVDQSKIECESKDGLLTVHIPKTSDSENRKLKINVK